MANPPEFVPLTPTQIVTRDVISEVLLKHDPSLVLISFQVEPGTNPGDNYLSLMYAVEVTAERKSGPETILPTGRNLERILIMFKTIPRNPIRQEQIRSARFYFREAQMYTQILPKFSKRDGSLVFPKCLAISVDSSDHIGNGHDYIAMENLKGQG